MTTAAKSKTEKASSAKDGAAEQKQHRVSFDFTPEAYEALNRLVAESESATKAEAVRKALRLFDRVLAGMRNGERLCLEGPEGRLRELTLL